MAEDEDKKVKENTPDDQKIIDLVRGPDGKYDIDGYKVDNVQQGSTKNNGNNKIIGDDKIDFIHGQSGNDALFGRGGKDIIKGGTGNDFVNGGEDSDLIYGFDGNDTLEGDRGSDYISGDKGDDTIIPGAGHDRVNGGAGRDEIVVDVSLSLEESTTLIDDYISRAEGDFITLTGVTEGLKGVDDASKINEMSGEEVMAMLAANGVTFTNAPKDLTAQVIERGEETSIQISER